jgi:glucose/arabinose dehydrogenase
MRTVAACLGLIGLLAVAACDDDSGLAGPGTDAGANPDSGGQPTQPVGGNVTLDLVTEGLTSPITLTESPDSSGRLFVVDQIGVVRVIASDGTLQDQPFLDVRDAIVTLMPDYDERGLLGLAFHPDFANNGRVFVYYTAPPRISGWDNTSTLAEYQVTPGATGAQAQKVAVISRRIIRSSTTTAAPCAFGADGMLYLSIGDGGGRDDEGEGEAQGTPLFGHVDDWYPNNPGGNGRTSRTT